MIYRTIKQDGIKAGDRKFTTDYKIEINQEAMDGIIVHYKCQNDKEWRVNPWSTRALIRELLKELDLFRE